MYCFSRLLALQLPISYLDLFMIQAIYELKFKSCYHNACIILILVCVITSYEFINIKILLLHIINYGNCTLLFCVNPSN